MSRQPQRQPQWPLLAPILVQCHLVCAPAIKKIYSKCPMPLSIVWTIIDHLKLKNAIHAQARHLHYSNLNFHKMCRFSTASSPHWKRDLDRKNFFDLCEGQKKTPKILWKKKLHTTTTIILTYHKERKKRHFCIYYSSVIISYNTTGWPTCKLCSFWMTKYSYKLYSNVIGFFL